MLVIVAQLKSIPSEIYEAAKVDGASPLRIAASIQLPLIRPALILSVVFSIIGTLQLFAEPLVLKTFSPAIVTEYTPNLSAYNNAFAYNDYGIASAEAVIIAVAAFVLSFGFLAWTNRRDGHDHQEHRLDHRGHRGADRRRALLPGARLLVVVASTKSSGDLFTTPGFWFGRTMELFNNVAQVFTASDASTCAGC